MYTVSQFKSLLTGKTGGSTLSDVADFNSTLWLAALRVKSKIDIKGMKRSTTLSSPLYDNITKYALPTDFAHPIDLLPQIGREGNPGSSNFTSRFSRQFSLRGELNAMAIDSVDGIEYLLARREPGGNVVTLADFESTTGWVASGDASGLYQETLNYVAGSTAMGFNLSGATGSGVITAAAITAQDFSTWRAQDSVFLYVYMPSVLTSVSLKRGSSSTAYYPVTVTTQQDGSAFRVGWNLLRFSLVGSVAVGSPNLASTTYLQLTMAYPVGTAISGVVVDSMTDQLGDYYQMPYYSKCCFSDSTGAWIETPVDDNTIINFDTDAITILVFEVLDDLNIELNKKGGRNSAFGEMDRKYAGTLGAVGHGGLYDQYARKYPSERITGQQVTYDFDL